MCYALFLATTVWFIAFLLDLGEARSGGRAAPWPYAIAIDLALIASFGIAHSVMARPGFKRVWIRIIPPAAERATYVLQSSTFLMLLFWLWQPISLTIWRLDGWGAILAIAAFAAGGMTIIAAVFLLGHLDFFGIRQAWDHLRGTTPRKAQFRTPSLYRLVRHPLQLGIVIIMFAVPHMTADGLLFAIAMLFYIFVGLTFEERALVREFGRHYEKYKSETPMLIPYSLSVLRLKQVISWKGKTR